jgi:hypothetical protein
MSEQTMRPSERLIGQFIANLSKLEELDEDVVTLIQRLHQSGQLNSRDLARELDRQREEWKRAETS